jgi:hypothetical protein
MSFRRTWIKWAFIALAVLASQWVMHEVGWKRGHEYGRTKGWAEGVTVCHSDAKWCEGTQSRAKRILTE